MGIAYYIRLPILLGALTAGLFFLNAWVVGAWGQGMTHVAVAAMLSAASFFVPWAMIPFAVSLPKALPWVHYEVSEHFGIAGAGRLRQRFVVFAMILFAGLPLLSIYGTVNFSTPTWQVLAEVAFKAVAGPAIFFALLALVLSFPEFGNRDTKADA